MSELQAGERKPLPELVEVIRRRWAAPWVAMDEGVQYVFAKGDISDLLEAYDELAALRARLIECKFCKFPVLLDKAGGEASSWQHVPDDVANTIRQALRVSYHAAELSDQFNGETHYVPQVDAALAWLERTTAQDSATTQEAEDESSV